LASSNLKSDNEWFFPRLTDYFDWEKNAIVQNSRKLEKLDQSDRKVALKSIDSAIQKHTRALTDKELVSVAFIIVEDLYKNITQNITKWDNFLEGYLMIVGMFFFSDLHKRKFRIRYIIDNHYDNSPVGLMGPVYWFPKFFETAGLTYICPHHQIYSEDQKKENLPEKIGAIKKELLEANRRNFRRAVIKCEREQSNYVAMIIDSDEQNMEFLLDFIDIEDEMAISVIRQERPVKGSKAILSHKYFRAD